MTVSMLKTLHADLYLRNLSPLEKAIVGLEGGKVGAKLDVNEFPGKGRGVVTMEDISSGEFVAEYKLKEVYKRGWKAAHVKEYEKNNESSYILEVQTSDDWDATRQMGSIGRLINHSSIQI